MKEKLKNKENFKSEKGITLVALVITVIVMLILAGVAISVIVDGEGLFSRTRQAAEEYEQAAKDENTQLQSLIEEIDRYLDGTPSTPGGGSDDENETPTPEGPIDAAKLAQLTNGSWDETKQINTPKLVSGMIAVYWDNNGVEKELTATNTETEWNNWYSYTAQTGSTATAGSGTSKWANAVTKNTSGEITGYWVWIPRYEYKLTAPATGSAEGTPGTIAVNFISTDTQTASSTDYKVHPAFTSNPTIGGGTSDLPGFWVAKYPAGFQEKTVDSTGNLLVKPEDADVDYSNLKYTTLGNQYTNAFGQTLNNPADANINAEIDALMSYPIFKPLTYAYNAINIDSSFRISQEIASATSFYGLSNADTHLMKNSEWGAVAYLTWSQYGRNGTEPNINNVNLNNTIKETINGTETTLTIYAVTGIYAEDAGTNDGTNDGTNNAHTNGTFTGNAYNTATGQLGSSTGNITGVYDLNGCVWERVSGYITNTGGETNRNRYGARVIAAAEKYKKIYALGTADESTAVDGSDSDTDTNNEKRQINYEGYANSGATYYGDAVLETSTASYGSTSWNGDYSFFPYAGSPFFVRGGYYSTGEGAGVFAFGDTIGHASAYGGFRPVCLATL